MLQEAGAVAGRHHTRPENTPRLRLKPKATQAPAELATGGQAVPLDGHYHQLPNTLEILGANRNKIVLLVVPSHTDPDHAHAVVMAAAVSDNVSSVDTLLMISVKGWESRTNRAAAQERWESQGRAEQSTGRDRRRPMQQVFLRVWQRDPSGPYVRDETTMTSDDSVFKAFSNFGIDDIPAEAAVSRRMLRRLEDIDNATIPGPTTPAACATLASSVVAHSVVELKTQLVGLKSQRRLEK